MTEGDVSDGEPGASPDPEARGRGVECVAARNRDLARDLRDADLGDEHDSWKIQGMTAL